MAESLLGTLVVDLKANSAQFVEGMNKTQKSLKSTGDSFFVTERRASKFADEGLGRIADISPQILNVLDDMAKKSAAAATALRLLGAAGVAIIGFEIGTKLAAEVDSIIRFGKSTAASAREIEKMNAALKDEAEFLSARRALVSSSLSTQQATITASAAITATQLRGQERIVDAIDVERKARQDILDIQERLARQELAGLQAKVRLTDDDLQREREIQGVIRRFAAERGRINVEADEATSKARDEEFEKRKDAEQAIADLVRARRDTERTAVVDRLTAEDRIAEALEASLASQIAGVQDAADQQVAAWQRQLEQRKIAQVEFDRFVVEQEKTTAAKVASINAKAAESRRQVLNQAAGAVASFAPAGDLGSIRSAVEQARQQLVAAQAGLTATVGQAVGNTLPGLPDMRQLTSGIQEQIARVQELDAAWAAVATSRRAYNEAVAAQAREENRPRLLEGIKAIEEFDKQLTQTAQGLETLRQTGVSSDAIWLEQARVVQAAREQYAALQQQFAGTPAVLELLQKRLGEIQFDGFQRRSVAAFDALQGGVAGAVSSVRFFVDDLDNELPRGVSRAVGQLGALTGAMNAVAQATTNAMNATRIFANSTAGPTLPSTAGTPPDLVEAQ